MGWLILSVFMGGEGGRGGIELEKGRAELLKYKWINFFYFYGIISVKYFIQKIVKCTGFMAYAVSVYNTFHSQHLTTPNFKVVPLPLDNSDKHLKPKILSLLKWQLTF